MNKTFGIWPRAQDDEPISSGTFWAMRHGDTKHMAPTLNILQIKTTSIKQAQAIADFDFGCIVLELRQDWKQGEDKRIPVYSYWCKNCRESFSVGQAFTTDASGREFCPSCLGEVREYFENAFG